MSSTIGEPFQLFLSSNPSRSSRGRGAVFCTHNRDLPGYATVTAHGDGIHIWDLRNLHAVASYSVGEHVAFAAPAFSLPVAEDGNRSVISYAVVWDSPGYSSAQRGRTIWVIRQNIFGPTVAASEMTAVVVDYQIIKICGTGLTAAPLLLVSKKSSLSLANAQIDIKSHLEWPGEGQHLETFVFPRESCSFIQDDTASCSSVAITCCQTGMIVHVRLALLGEEIILVGTCEVPVINSTSGVHASMRGVTCSPSGILSFIDRRGSWATYQLVSVNSSLILIPVSKYLNFQRVSTPDDKLPGNHLSIVSLGTSLVFLAAQLEETQDISLQIWDLSYGVLLTIQSMSLPSPHFTGLLHLTVADEGQVLLTVTPRNDLPDKSDDLKRSSIYVVPVDSRLKSSLASALRKTALTTQWLAPDPMDNHTKKKDELSKLISKVETSLRECNVLEAEQVFLKWVDSHSSREAALGHEFVKKVFNVVLPRDPPPNYAYAPRITRCLLENSVVSTVMLNGHLITALRQRGDWENAMLALTKVMDISEDELMASAKILVDRQRISGHAMEVDTSEGYVPPLWSYISACVSYPFSVVPMRLAIRKHLSDAQDLVSILEVLENWLQGGTECEMEALLKSVATSTEMPSGGVESPPYPKVILFLQALLDASFVALLQYPPSYDLLRRTLSYIKPEIALMERLEPLHGMLEPFAKAQRSKENMGASKESPEEWRKRKKQLEQQAGLSGGLYRLEELVL